MIFNIISTNNKETLSSCIQQTNKADRLLFLGNATSLLTQPMVLKQIKQYKCYILKNECTAKGIVNLIPENIEIITYSDFVEQIIKCEKNITWN